MRNPVFLDQLVSESSLPNQHKLPYDSVVHTPRIAPCLTYANSITKKKTSITKNSYITTTTDYFKSSRHEQTTNDFCHDKHVSSNSQKTIVSLIHIIWFDFSALTMSVVWNSYKVILFVWSYHIYHIILLDYNTVIPLELI